MTATFLEPKFAKASRTAVTATFFKTARHESGPDQNLKKPKARIGNAAAVTAPILEAVGLGSQAWYIAGAGCRT